MKTLLVVASLALLLQRNFAGAQDAPPSRHNTYHVSSQSRSAAPRLVSPEVHPDRTITFRLLAPGANQASLLFGAADPKPLAMKKDDQGVWSVTIGPVEPEIYTYVYLLNGTRILDRANPVLKNGRVLDASVVEIPGNPPRFDQ